MTIKCSASARTRVGFSGRQEMVSHRMMTFQGPESQIQLNLSYNL